MKKHKIVAIIIGGISISFLFSTFDFGSNQKMYSILPELALEENYASDDITLEESYSVLPESTPKENYISQESLETLNFSEEEGSYSVSNTIDSFTNLLKQISSSLTAVLSILVAAGVLPKKKKGV